MDESITASVQYRLRDLQSSAAQAAVPVLPNARDNAEQVLDPTGRVLASSRPVASQPMLTATELSAAEHGQTMVEHPSAGGLPGPVRIAAAPTAGGSRVVVAAVSLADRDAALGDLAGELAVAFPLVLLAAVIGAYLLAAGSLRPVERMRARAAAITAEDPEQRLPVLAARDEISRLGTTFNDLLARLHAALSRERRFVADASHELRTPLSLLTTELELALQRPRSAGQLTEALRSALEETGRLSRLAQDLLLLARTDQAGGEEHPNGLAAITLQPLVTSMVDRYHTAGLAQELTVECPSHLAVHANRDDLDRALSNLIDNALQHGATPIAVRADQTSDDEQWVRIDVRDHGPGLDPEFHPRAFDRFTRADTARTSGGAGLGLAITAALARRNGGRVTAANHEDGGAVFTLTLPGALMTPQQQGM
jgi:signal transduction histidine kinase